MQSSIINLYWKYIYKHTHIYVCASMYVYIHMAKTQPFLSQDPVLVS